jgi:hypothetical protein
MYISIDASLEKVVDGIKEKQKDRCRSGSWYEMTESTKPSSRLTSEIVTYHKVKRIFLSLTDMEKKTQIK